ncbi:MAG: alkaline phosphatase D family protein [Pseudomonadota bacterium]
MSLKKLLTAASFAALAACSTAHQAEQAIAIAPEAPSGAIRARPMSSAPVDETKTLTRIVFASCAQQNEDQSIWDKIAAENPGLVLYMGDNVYGDVRSNDPALPELKAAYMRLADSEPFARVRAAAPVLTVWDDHDMGLNDGGADYQYKEQSEKLFEYVWAIGADDERAQRPGVYGSWITGEEGKRVQIIMLDTRYFRSPLKPTDEPNAHGKERWLPDADPSKTMLGEAQWAWLDGELKKPAELRLLVSSIQVMSEGHGWEAWREFPLEREKLYDVIERTGAANLIILSGDRHSAALYERGDVIDYPLFEATSSSLNLPASKWRAQSGETWVEPDPNRLGGMYYDANYGRIDIDWERGSIAVSIRSADGGEALARTINLATTR